MFNRKNGTSQKNRGGSNYSKGIFKLKKIFYRKDRVFFNKSKLESEKITQMMGWCNDINSKHYNKLINIKKKLNMKDFIEKIINTTI